MKNLNEIKNKISNYDYMSYQEYKNLKEEIFSLDDDLLNALRNDVFKMFQTD